jgi:F-type H+-transporting ATPase subunit alpha
LVVGDRQTGKSTVCIDTILNQKKNFTMRENLYFVYVAIGQKASTAGRNRKMLEEKGAMAYHYCCC